MQRSDAETFGRNGGAQWRRSVVQTGQGLPSVMDQSLRMVHDLPYPAAGYDFLPNALSP